MRLRIPIASTAWLSVVRYCLLTVAIACLGFYGYSYLDRLRKQISDSEEFDRTSARNAAIAVSATAGEASPISPTARHPAPFSKPSPTGLIGRLSVPGLHLSAMVREGIDRSTLQVSVGHIPGTALPGQNGNVGVAGHRDTFFRGLRGLKTGDEIRFSTLSGDFRYVVESLMIVEPEYVAVLSPSSENVLTLVTCYPFLYIGSAPKRFVVRARQVSPQTLAAVE